MTQPKTETAPQSIEEAVQEYLNERDGVPVSVMDDMPTAPIRIGTDLGAPPPVPDSASTLTIDVIAPKGADAETARVPTDD